MRRIYILFLILVLSGCAGTRGNFKSVKDNKAVGVFSYKIVDGKGEDITNSCIVHYTFGNDEHTPAYKIKDTPHFLEFNKKIKVEYISCLQYLLVYHYNFSGFELEVSDNNIYNFGKYYLRYDYKDDYEDTSFYKKAKKCVYDDNDSESEECKDAKSIWVNEGKLTLLKHETAKKGDFEKFYPAKGKKQIIYKGLKPKNILINKLE